VTVTDSDGKCRTWSTVQQVATGGVVGCLLVLLVDAALCPPASLADWTPYVDGAMACVALGCAIAAAAVSGISGPPTRR
jgi:hypothetical protein